MPSKSLYGYVKKAFGIATERKALSLADPGIEALFGVLPTESGVSVTSHTALRIPAVLQAVRLISEAVGSLPCKLYAESNNGKQPAKDHDAYRLVHSRSNPWTSSGQLRVDLTRDALLFGGGYALVTRFDDGRPFRLDRLDPSLIARQFEDTGEPYYEYAATTGKVRFSYRDVLHVTAFADTSPVRLGREAMGITAVLERHAAQLFGSGARPAAMLYNEGKATGDDGGAKVVGNILSAWNKLFRAGKQTAPLILDNGWTYQQIALTSTDAQFIENRLEQINEIARVFGVPPHMLFQLERATWSNAEQMAAMFLQLCLRSWLDRWQDAYSNVLLTDDEADSFYFEFVIDDLQRADAKGRAEIFGKLIAARVMTPNEARAAINLPPITGGDELANPYTTTSTPAAPDAPQDTTA